MIRNMAVTVRLPGVRMAPTSRTVASFQTRLEKMGRIRANSVLYSSGRVSIEHLS